jgi:hypothetical protein
MRLPDNKDKYTSQFQYVEYGVYVPKINKLIRQRDDSKKAILFSWEEVNAKIAKSDQTGLYTSVFQYNDRDIDTAASLGSLYFDFDSDSEPEVVLSEVYKVVDYLLQFISRDAIRVFFSGKKGFHIECEAIALGISASDDLAGVFRFIANYVKETLGVSSLDFNVYDTRRMWRVPNTRHQHTGLYKVECMQLLQDGVGLTEIIEHAREPHPFDVIEQNFNFKANQWYREFTYDYEQSLAPKRTSSDMLARFLEQGTGSYKHFDEGQKFFDKFRLLKGCPAIRELELKAKRNHHLDHYERLFLCSILTYHEDAIKYLHEILSECSDYQFEISSAHVDDWIRRREKDIGGRPFSCTKAQQVGISCSGCEKLEPKPRVERLANGKYMETAEFSQPSPIRLAYGTNKMYTSF